MLSARTAFASFVVLGVLAMAGGCSSSREQAPIDTGPAPATCNEKIEGDYTVDFRVTGGGCPDPPTTFSASIVPAGRVDDNGNPEYDANVPYFADDPCTGVFIECVLYAHCIRNEATVDIQWTFATNGSFHGKDGLNGRGVYQNCVADDIGTRVP